MNPGCCALQLAGSGFKFCLCDCVCVRGTQVPLSEPQFPYLSAEDIVPTPQGCGNKASPGVCSTHLPPRKHLRADQPLTPTLPPWPGSLAPLSDPQANLSARNPEWPLGQDWQKPRDSRTAAQQPREDQLCLSQAGQRGHPQNSPVHSPCLS